VVSEGEHTPRGREVAEKTTTNFVEIGMLAATACMSQRVLTAACAVSCAHRVPRCRLSASASASEELFSIRLVSADGALTLEGVRRGELLRTALLRKGATPHNDWSRLICCRGLGTCGTCAVEITSGEVRHIF
jgi:hypothetical protein